MKSVTKEFEEAIDNLLNYHLNIGTSKSVSYFPIEDLGKFVRGGVQSYVELALEKGLAYQVIENGTWISGGVVYVYSETEFSRLLNRSDNFLREIGWPTNPEEFLLKLSSEWYPDDHPVLSVVKKAFGQT